MPICDLIDGWKHVVPQRVKVVHQANDHWKRRSRADRAGTGC
jgi:hypothetical protein